MTTDLTRKLLEAGICESDARRRAVLTALASTYGIRYLPRHAVDVEPFNLIRVSAAWTGGNAAVATYRYFMGERGLRPVVTEESSAFGEMWESTGYSLVVPRAGMFDAMTQCHYLLGTFRGSAYSPERCGLELQAGAVLHERGIEERWAAELAATGEARNYLQQLDEGVSPEYLDSIIRGTDA